MLSVIVEIWHLMWYLMSGNYSDTVVSSLLQIFLGSAIAGSVIYSLCKESAAFLLPYLLLQTMGLAAVIIILVALLFICIIHDYETIKSFLEFHGPQLMDNIGEKYLVYIGWGMVGSCIIVLALQIWLISIVFSCWQYFRDKQAYNHAKRLSRTLTRQFNANPHENIFNFRDRSESAGRMAWYYRVSNQTATNNRPSISYLKEDIA
uniref:Uncharacterized protein n=1 Tax=Acrobeloides nanus TaxID=290746 RepID=A0A914E1F7_9BILA